MSGLTAGTAKASANAAWIQQAQRLDAFMVSSSTTVKTDAASVAPVRTLAFDPGQSAGRQDAQASAASSCRATKQFSAGL
jgi:hypothetical protein